MVITETELCTSYQMPFLKLNQSKIIQQHLHKSIYPKNSFKHVYTMSKIFKNHFHFYDNFVTEPMSTNFLANAEGIMTIQVVFQLSLFFVCFFV